MAAAATTKEATTTEQLKISNTKHGISRSQSTVKAAGEKSRKFSTSIEGVYMTTIDSQKQKVTVTGNIKPDTLVKKLIKTVKPAEFWPEPEPEPEPKPNPMPNNGSNKNKNKNKNKNQPNPNTESSDTREPKEPEQKNSSGESKEPPAEGKKKKKGKKENNNDNGSEAKEVQDHEKPPPLEPNQQAYCT